MGNMSPRKRRCRLYIDESGDHTYREIDQPEKRYLSLIGCVFRMSDLAEFTHELEELKYRHFGSYPHRDPDEPIILHRNDIINRRGPFSLLRNQEVEEAFNKDLLHMFKTAPYMIIAVVIDKKQHLERYGDFAFHPYHYCLTAILDRYCGYLNYFNCEGDVLAEARGGTEDTQLKSAYRRTYESGSLLFRPPFHQKALTSKEIKLKPKKANVAGLQVADLLAYPVKQEMLLEKNRIPDPGQIFGKEICVAIRSKYNRQKWTGQIWGYGKIWLPVK